jgi:hypothetical protein
MDVNEEGDENETMETYRLDPGRIRPAGDRDSRAAGTGVMQSIGKETRAPEGLSRMIDRNSVHPVSLYKRMADALDEPDCLDCNDGGYVDIDAGGGNMRTMFCSCAKGQEMAEANEKAKESNDNNI